MKIRKLRIRINIKLLTPSRKKAHRIDCNPWEERDVFEDSIPQKGSYNYCDKLMT